MTLNSLAEQLAALLNRLLGGRKPQLQPVPVRVQR